MDNSQNMQQWENEAAEIDLFQVLIHQLEHIRPILICALIGAAILGAAKLVSELRVAENPGAEGPAAETAEDEEAMQEYEEALANYELQMKIYDEQLQTAYDSLTQYEEYRENSILLSMDPMNYYQKEFVWFVNAEEERTGAVLNAYAGVFGWDYYYYVQERISDRCEALYLRELISTSYNLSTSGLSLTISSPTEKLLQEISNATESYLEEKWPQVMEAMGGYEITLVVERQYVTTETFDSGTVIQAQKSLDQQILTLRNTILDLRTRISGLNQPEPPVEDATKQTTQGFSKNNVIMYALIGLLLGVFLSAGWLMVCFVVSDVVLDEEEVQRRFGVYVLASVRRFNGNGLWRRWLSRLSGDVNRTATPEAAAALACVNLESMMKAAGRRGENVLLVGDDEGALKETERLIAESKSGAETSKCISVGGNILVDQGAMEQLQDYDNIVLVVRKGSTRNREIGKEVEKLLTLKKNVVGLFAL